MNKAITSAFTILLFNFSFGQYCMTGGPSTNADSNIESLNLVGASGSISFTGCPGVIGVQEFLVQTAFLNAGGNYTANIQFGTCGGNYSGVGQAWIDFNINGIFEPTESIGTWSGMPPVPMSLFNFNVPAGATTGQSRMRVIQAESMVLPLDPCAAFTWGSTTDFSVYIQNGVDCSGYTGDDETDPRPVPSLPFTDVHSNAICYSNQNPVYASPDVYYLIIPGIGISGLDISLCGSSFDTFLSVMDTDGNIIAINDDSPACGTQSELSVSTAGHDSLYVIVEGWGILTGNYILNINQSTLGQSEQTIGDFMIYPNPATETISIKSEKNGQLTIRDSHGRIVQTHVLNSTSVLVDVSSLTKGIYFVELKSNDQLLTQKLILE